MREIVLLRENKELRIEEPAVVRHVRQEQLRGLAPEGFETALGVGEAGSEEDPDCSKLNPRDRISRFSRRATMDACISREPTARS